MSPDGNKLFLPAIAQKIRIKMKNDIYIMDAIPGASYKKLTTWPAQIIAPQWSPDGKYIAYLQSSSNENFTMYGEDMLAVIPQDGGTPNLFPNHVDKQL